MPESAQNEALAPEIRFAVGQAAAVEVTPYTERVIQSLGLAVEALPSSPTPDDIARVADLVPKDRHLQVCALLILAAIDLVEPEHQNPDAERRYTAGDRAQVFRIAESLTIPAVTIHESEQTVAEQLWALVKVAQEKQQPDTSSAVAAAAGRTRMFRRIATGAGAAAGALAIGITGGLAAPLIAPLLVGVTGGALGFLATSGGAVAIGMMFGVAGAGLSGYRVKARVAGIQEFEFEELFPREKGQEMAPSLTATICCAGLLLQPEDYIEPYRTALSSATFKTDAWSIKAEVPFFLEQGRAIDTYLRDKLIAKGVSEVIKRTALSAVMSAVALPATVYSSVAFLVDNNWQRSADKAGKVGILLADVLEKEIQGKRPTVLIGSGLGALTVFRALRELDQRGSKQLVCDAHLISLPRAPSPEDWASARRAVSRRFTNSYSANDWVLALVARVHSASLQVAGLVGAKAESIEDIDIGDLLEGHLQLREKLPAIIDRIDLTR